MNVIYIDKFACGSLIRVLQLRVKKGKGFRRAEVRVLEPPGRTPFSAAFRTILTLFGLKITEPDFFAGYLRALNGESLYGSAWKAANGIAYRAAEQIVERSRLLALLDSAWGRKTVRLHIARSLWLKAREWALRVITADILSRQNQGGQAVLAVQSPLFFLSSFLRDRTLGISVVTYRWSMRALKKNRAILVLWWLRERFREIKSKVDLLNKTKSVQKGGSLLPGPKRPTLLLLQEDELSLDHSYRSQPYWLHAEDGRPPFRTIILQGGPAGKADTNNDEWKAMDVVVVSPKGFLFIQQTCPPSPLRRDLNKIFWKIMIRSFVSRPSHLEVVILIARLFFRARSLASFCEATGVKAFMTCENYMRDADAMQLIAPRLGISLVSYQYSNMGEIGPVMMTTADAMLTFSSLYHRRWRSNDLGPQKYVDIGYIFDRSFSLIQERARGSRSKLAKAGAKFVVGYFDESVQTDKFGLIHTQDHKKEISFLLELLLADPTLGIVIKTQFQRNSPRHIKELEVLLDSAQATGRYIELSHGGLRNTVFPAEAALCSDIVIGHIVGATAALEAALTGTRCLLLNPYDYKTETDDLYALANIVYPSIESAMEAIQKFRGGALDKTGLGDWSPILDRFDPFRDGQAAVRMRKFLEEALSTRPANS